ncbi:MAG: ATP-binding protein [Bacteroidota bacterium]
MKRLAWLFFLFSQGILYTLLFVSGKKEINPDHQKQLVERNLDLEIKNAIDYLENIRISDVNEPLKSVYVDNWNWYTEIVIDGEIRNWSDQRIVLKSPYLPPVNEKVSSVFLKEGVFLIVQKELDYSSGDARAVAFLPLIRKYPISNKLLPQSLNPSIFGSIEGRILKSSSENKVQWNNLYLFSIDFDSVQPSDLFHSFWSSFLCIIHFVVLLFSIVLIWNYYPKFRVTIILFLLLAERFSIYYSGIASLHFSSELFDPKSFASSEFNSSIGDLVLNIVFGCLWVLSLIFHVLISRRKKDYIQNLRKHFVPVLILSVVLTSSAVFIFSFCIHLVHDFSNLVLDISKSLDFDSSRYFLSFNTILMGVSLFLINHLVARSIFTIRRNVPFGKYLWLIIGLLITLMIFWQDRVLAILMFGNLLYLLIVFETGLHKTFRKLTFNTFFYILLGAILVSFVYSGSIMHAESKRSVRFKDSFYRQLARENDILGEFLLGETIGKVRSDIFIKNKFLSPFSDKEQIVEKIKKVHLPNYFDRYDVEIMLFNGAGDPIYGMNKKTYDVLSLAVDNSSEISESLYVMGGVLPEYKAFIELERYGHIIGSVIISLKLKKVVPQSVYPKLLTDVSLDNYSNSQFDYALFLNDELQYSSTNTEFLDALNIELLQKEELYEQGINESGYLIKAYKEDEKKILIASDSPGFLQYLSNFSFAFLLFVSAIALLALFYFVALIFRKEPINLSTKIQLSLNFAFFFPLIALSLGLYSIIISESRLDILQSYSEKVRAVSSNIYEEIKNYYSGEMSKEELASSLEEFSKAIENDINLYNQNGQVIASSQPNIYDYRIISEYLNPQAYHSIIINASNNVTISQEFAGDLYFKSAYYGLEQTESNVILGVVGIPFYDYSVEKDQKVIEVFNSTLNIFTIVFLLTYLIAYSASHFLTQPLKMLASRIRKTNFASTNEPVEWRSGDEIGSMVKAYNEMLVKLDESRDELSKKEKEAAWREMARQVAHEIKNPLTPMKLKLQHLGNQIGEGQIQDGNPEKTIKSILSQIDTLSDIASSFSAFAQMPIPQKKRFNLSKVLIEAVDFFKRDGVPIKTEIEPKVYVEGDNKMFQRIFSNILINAIQASQNDVDIKVILITEPGDKVLIQFYDKGIGIPSESQEKIFLPNFTTKSSGSGIGLAIAKRGIEHAGGRIWVESEERKGTVFYIELPKVV